MSCFFGQKISYNIDNVVIENAAMYGFISNKNDCVSVANRIFETRIYNWFISQEATDSRMYSEGVNDKKSVYSGQSAEYGEDSGEVYPPLQRHLWQSTR